MRRAALALLALPLVGAACGSGGGKSTSTAATTTAKATTTSALDAVMSATAKTSGAPSEHMTLKGAAVAAGTSITLGGQGDFDQKAHDGAMHATFSAGGISGAIDEVIAGTTVYMKSPIFAAALPGGKTWLKIDLQKVAHTQGINMSALLNQSPAETLAQLKALVQVRSLGAARVAGVATTHYRGRLDLAKLPQGKKILALAKAKYGPYDVWVDGSGYIRQIHFSAAMSPQGGAATTLAMTLGLSRFGEAVTVHVPAASDTFDAANAAIPGLTS